MKKKEILEKLKTYSNCQSAKFPSHIDITIDKDCLTIALQTKCTVENMQNDCAAFEAWSIILKNWIPIVNNVIIKWVVPNIKRISINEMQHYQRFLYRVKKFCHTYDWAEIYEDNRECLNILMIEKGNKNILNTPSKERSRKFKEKKELRDYSESELEEFILSNDKTLELFKRKFNLRLVDNQLPVGVFDSVKSKKTLIFTGGKSAVDIWGINTDGDCCLFELKDYKNTKVGALTEMLFYSFLIQDVIKGIFKFESTTYKGLKEIQEAKKVKCFLLAPNTHPLIDKGLFKLLNDSNANIKFGNVKINDTLTFTLL